MNLGTAQVIRADSRHLPLADNSVDLVVTSPPYFALRSYQDGGEHYAGQVGSEATPAEFVAALLEVTRECVRVLKPSGSLWVNLGDKYAGGDGTPGGPSGLEGGKSQRAVQGQRRKQQHGVRAKSLIGIPWRYALACIDDLGLILRAEVIWSKPNGLPESVTDRVRRSHEQWFHFTLNPRYFSAMDEIREQSEKGRPQASRAAALAARHGIGETHRQALLARGLGDQGRSAATQSGTGKNTAEVLRLCEEADRALGSYTREFTMTSQTLGKLPGSVWTVPTEPLKVPDHISHAKCCNGVKQPECKDGIDHFAAFPTEWPRRIIQGWSPAGVCVECGEGRRPVVTKELRHKQFVTDEHRSKMRTGVPLGLSGRADYYSELGSTEATITGYACACPEPTAPTRPSVILDPFGGTGTTALVAKALGRHGITVDMSADYCRLAEWRTNDRDQLAKVLGIAKAEQQDDAQMDLFDMEETPKPARPSGGLAMANAKGRNCVTCGYRTQRPSGCERCGGVAFGEPA